MKTALLLPEVPLLTSSLSFITQYRKDVRLPVQLQRAMAAEAEAAREARAKVKTIICQGPRQYVIL